MHETHDCLVIHLQLEQCLAGEEMSFDEAGVELESLAAILQCRMPLFELEMTKCAVCVVDGHTRITDLHSQTHTDITYNKMYLKVLTMM